jgi:DNA-binding transcriptional MerR regulator
METEPVTFTVGQLSRATGVSVRALHYYDELGLLKPDASSGSGYRLYAKDAIMRLQQITALKKLGFTLSHIKTLVSDDSGALEETRWKAALAMQIQAIEREEAQLEHLKRLLRRTLNALEMTGDVQPEDIFAFIRAVQPQVEAQRQAWLKARFTPREIDILMALPKLDEDGPRTRMWVQLVRELREHRHEPSDSPASQHLANRVLELSDHLFHGDEPLIEKYWTMVRPDPGEGAKIYGLDSDLMDYIEAIIVARDARLAASR